MSKYKDVILPIIEETNVKAFQISYLLSLLGIIVLGCTVGFLEVGTYRTTGVVIAIIFIISPFTLSFIMDKHKKIGALRFTEFEIYIKINNEETLVFDSQNLNKFDFNIIDYEGETKTRDLIRSSSRYNVRTGADNEVFWTIDDTEFHYNFKLSSELQKRKALFFLKAYKSLNS